MAIIGCYWDSTNLELLIECYDEVQHMYLSFSDSSGKLSNKDAPTQADETAVLNALNRAFTNCASVQSPVTAIHYKGPHRTTVQGQGPFKNSYSIKGMTMLAEAVLATVDNFSNTNLSGNAFRKRSNIPKGKVLTASNALVASYCNSSLKRSQKFALFAAMDIKNSDGTFRTLANKVIKSQLRRNGGGSGNNGGYSTADFRSQQALIFSKLA